jgi:hypothetical protein
MESLQSELALFYASSGGSISSKFHLDISRSLEGGFFPFFRFGFHQYYWICNSHFLLLFSGESYWLIMKKNFVVCCW